VKSVLGWKVWLAYAAFILAVVVGLMSGPRAKDAPGLFAPLDPVRMEQSQKEATEFLKSMRPQEK